MSEDDLQVDKQLTHLRIDRRNVKRYRKVKVIGKEAQYDTYEIEMERPQYEPAYPQPIRVFQKIDIAEHEPFYRLICSTGYRFERFERQRIFVVLRVSACIEPFQHKDQ